MAENTNPDRESGATEVAFRPITRSEHRSLWLKEYGEQDVALQSWASLVEEQNLEIEVIEAFVVGTPPASRNMSESRLWGWTGDFWRARSHHHTLTNRAAVSSQQNAHTTLFKIMRAAGAAHLLA